MSLPGFHTKHIKHGFLQKKVKRRQTVTYFNKDHTSDSWMPDELISQLTFASVLALHTASSLYNCGSVSTLSLPIIENVGN